MLLYFLLGIVLLVGVVLIGRWYATAEPKLLVKVLTRLVFGIIIAAVLFLAFTGRIGWAIGAAAALLPWVLRLVGVVRTAKNFSRMTGADGGGGQSSTVNTRFLRATLDHETGELDGNVVDGPFAGRTLGAMSLSELLELLKQCRIEDPQSTQVLEAYLDRVHLDWRTKASEECTGEGAGNAPQSGGDMTREEAYAVLGLNAGATETEIKAAYHRIISVLHPDKGGSNFLAAKVNQAKDLLLGS